MRVISFFLRDMLLVKLKFTPCLALMVYLLAGCEKAQLSEDAFAASTKTVVAPIPEDALVVDFPQGVFGERMIETMAGDIATLNPLIIESLAGSMVMGRILDSLITLDPETGAIIPSLAKSWEISNDNLSYTFHLRRGVHWNYG